MQTFKIVLVGDGRVGKTSLVERIKTGKFKGEYVSTQGVDLSSLVFNTNYGSVCFKIWDCAGRDEYKGLGPGYYYGADAAIVMFDVTNKSSYDNAKKLVIPFDHLPVVILGNKTDIKDRSVCWKDVSFDAPHHKYFDYSVKGDYNFENPWLELARQLLKKSDLILMFTKEQEPPKVITDIKEMNAEIKELNVKEVIKVTPQSSVSWIDIPGGRMKVTYEFFSDDK